MMVMVHTTQTPDSDWSHSEKKNLRPKHLPWLHPFSRRTPFPQRRVWNRCLYIRIGNTIQGKAPLNRCVGPSRRVQLKTVGGRFRNTNESAESVTSINRGVARARRHWHPSA